MSRPRRTPCPPSLCLMERERGLEPPTLCLGSRSGPVQVPIRLRPLVSASPYLIGSGDDSWVPQASAIAALFPSVWLQFCYSARSLFCSPRQNRPRTTKQADSAFPGPSRDGRHGNVRTPLRKRVQKQLWSRSRALMPPPGGNERGRTGVRQPDDHRHAADTTSLCAVRSRIRVRHWCSTRDLKACCESTDS